MREGKHGPAVGVTLSETRRAAEVILHPHVTFTTSHLSTSGEQKSHGQGCKGDFTAAVAVAIGQMKKLRAMISALMAEVAALRKTVAQKPENADLQQSNLKAAMETTKPFVDDAMPTYDETIELVCSTDVWKN